jgi:hypothetical protein
MSRTVSRSVGFTADSCSPDNARMIGTPAFSNAYICRLNSMSSGASTRGRPSLARKPPTSLPSVETSRAGSIATGVVPSARSCVATALLSAASSTPFTRPPRPSRPLYWNLGTSILELVRGAHRLGDGGAAFGDEVERMAT